MDANVILGLVGIVLLALAVGDSWRARRLTARARTWLLIAGMFMAVMAWNYVSRR